MALIAERGLQPGRVAEGPKPPVSCAGQTSVDADGSPRHIGDVRAQIGLVLDDLGAVLSAGGMGLGDLARVGVCTTDVDEAMKHFDVLGARFGAVNAAPPMTLLGVTRLAIPGLMLEIDGSAAARASATRAPPPARAW